MDPYLLIHGLTSLDTVTLSILGISNGLLVPIACHANLTRPAQDHECFKHVETSKLECPKKTHIPGPCPPPGLLIPPEPWRRSTALV